MATTLSPERQEKLRLKWRRSYWKNREKKLKRNKDYRLRNLERCRKANREWQSKRWAYRQEYMRKYYLAHQEKIKQKSNSGYYANHRQKLEKNKAYRKANPAKIAERGRNYYIKNKAERLEYHRQWRAKNRGKWLAMTHRRRALEKKATVNLAGIEAWMQSVRRKRVAVCYWCGERIPTSEIHFDHIVPIIRGGLHAVENLCVSCVQCNLKKGKKSPRLWVRMGQQTLEL